LIGISAAFTDLTQVQKAQLATIGARFAALLSLFNIGRRIAWASLSDYLGRKRTYVIFFALEILLYSLAPYAGRAGQAYNATRYVLAGLLVIGLICNLAVRPVAERYYLAQDPALSSGGATPQRA
jgi:MFS family permease